jgi:hypothetical protein
MANLFDVANAPEAEPHQFVIGDYVRWKRPDLIQDYPAATHSVAFIARLSGGGNTEFTINATSATDYWLFTITSAASALYTKGHYHWQIEVVETASSNRIVVDRGTLDILFDMDVNNVDPRSHAQIMVNKIESILEGKADADVSSYSINGRSLTKMSFEELLNARDFYRKEFNKEIQQELAKNGEQTNSTILVRF